MAQQKGMEYLKSKLNIKRPRVLLRYEYYEQKHRPRDFGISTPDELLPVRYTNGWCTKAVDALADRLQFAGWREDNFDLEGIYNMNNPDVLYNSAILSALISSCCFIVVSPSGGEIPRLQVVDGGNATGIIDEFTGLLQEGYAVLERDDYDQVTRDAYFTTEETIYYEAGKEISRVSNPAPYPLLAPIIYRPDAMRPFGHSRISRKAMELADMASRTLKRSEISAEYYSIPQKWVTGMSEDAEPMDKWKATASSMLTFTKDDEGGSPEVGQFSQASPTPYSEQLVMLAGEFCRETGLAMSDMIINTANPASADAIKAEHESTRLTVRKAQQCFGSSFLNAGYLAACLRDQFPYEREQLYLTHAAWNPIFEPDASQLGALGDAIAKINQAQPGYLTEEKIHDLLGV
jgi:hypothetical protein